jgi:hypothetical protein
MEPPDHLSDTEKKLRSLEQDLNDLRQGLALVNDYYRDLEKISRRQEAVEAVDEIIAKPLVDDDLEFEGIWRFHEDALAEEPGAAVPCQEMYEAFVQYCTRTGRSVVEQDAFEFVFARIEHPAPVLERGAWIGYRLRTGAR